MSTPVQNNPAHPQAPGKAKPAKRYRAIHPLAVPSLACGVLSILTLLHWVFAVFPLSGMILGYWALRKIRRAPEEITGLRFAQAGWWLSLVCWVLGYSWLGYQFYTQVPSGYQEITFAELQPDPSQPARRFPPLVDDLEEKIFIQGYMSPGPKRSGITHFLLARDNGVCNFCAPRPKPTELIEVELIGGLETEYTTKLVGVGGKFTAKPDPATKKYGGVPYRVEADFFR